MEQQLFLEKAFNSFHFFVAIRYYFHLIIITVSNFLNIILYYYMNTKFTIIKLVIHLLKILIYLKCII